MCQNINRLFTDETQGVYRHAKRYSELLSEILTLRERWDVVSSQ